MKNKNQLEEAEICILKNYQSFQDMQRIVKRIDTEFLPLAVRSIKAALQSSLKPGEYDIFSDQDKYNRYLDLAPTSYRDFAGTDCTLLSMGIDKLLLESIVNSDEENRCCCYVYSSYWVDHGKNKKVIQLRECLERSNPPEGFIRVEDDPDDADRGQLGYFFKRDLTPPQIEIFADANLLRTYFTDPLLKLVEWFEREKPGIDAVFFPKIG